MSPAYRIVADDRDASAAFRGRLLSLRLTETSGPQTDSLAGRLDDRGPRGAGGGLALPRTGVVLAVSLGYEAAANRTDRAAGAPRQGLVEMGRFVVDEIEIAGPPAALAFRAKSADLRASLKQRKTRSWDDTTIGKLMAVIAGEHNLLRGVGEDLYGIALPHIDQIDESDMHLLTRLGRQYDAVAKQSGEYLLFVRRGVGRSAAGKRIEPVTLAPRRVGNYRAVFADRGRYAAVEAHWRDVRTGRRNTVTAGGAGEPRYVLRDNHIDEETALQTAQAKLAALNRGKGTLSLTLTPGNPRVHAETPLTLSGFRGGIDGAWIAAQVTHEIDGGGYVTRLEAETPADAEESAADEGALPAPGRGSP